MVDDSWLTADVITKARMNKKTLFVDTGANISALATTYGGMMAYCTSTGSGFVADQLYQRNAANSAWGIIGSSQLPYLKLSTTIGDYTSPNAAVASSSAPAVSAVFGTNADQASETFSTYTDQTDANTSWVPSSNTDGSRVDVTDDDLEGTTNGKADFQVYYDFGSALSDEQWIIKFKIVTTITSPTTADQNWMFFGMSSITGAHGTAQDFLGFGIKDYNSNLKIMVVEATAQALSSGTLTNFTHTPTTETLYVQMTRLSSTSFKIELFSDSGYTTSVESQTVSVSASTDTLRYLKLAYLINNNTGVNDITVDIDDVIQSNANAANIYDGSTSTAWQSTSEASPAIYVDLSGSAREIVGVALNLNRTATTVTAIKIRASIDTSFDDTENMMYLNVSDFTDDTWRYMANNFLATNCRYVQVIGVGTGVLALNEIKVRYGVSDLIKILTHRHLTRNTSAADSFVDSN
jgi:hypothetical protein